MTREHTQGAELMRSAFVDVKWSRTPENPTDAPNTGWVSYSGPRDYPSAALLQHAGVAAASGEDVSFHYVTAADVAEGAPALRESVAGVDRVVVCAPSANRAVAEALRGALTSGDGALPESAVSLFDAWAPEPRANPTGVWGYDAATGVASGRAEVDVTPALDPVHPWVRGIVANGSTDAWEERLDAVLESFGRPEEEKPIWQAPEVDFYLNDHRVPLNMDRVRAVARAVSRGLREHHTMLKLHLRAWPRDLNDRRLLDHLTCLPIGSLEILAGSLLPATLASREGGHTVALLSEVLGQISEAGLSHIAGLSVVIGMPGESAEDCIEALNATIKVAVEAKIRRVRVAYWLGGGAPEDADAQARMFMESHPDWHPVEYAGLFDFVALLRSAMPQLEILGPGFNLGWAAPRMEDFADEG